MNYGELKAEIKNLGFEETATMGEYKEIVKEACNRAIDTINTTVMPYVKMFSVEGDTEYDMAVLVEDFVDFYGKPKYTENGVRKTLTDFSIENNSKLITNGNTGLLDIYYKAYPERITSETLDDFEIQLNKLVLPLIPLLASYYVWLDDDTQKATMYFNQYDMKKNEIMANKDYLIGVSFKGGVSWHN